MGRHITYAAALVALAANASVAHAGQLPGNVAWGDSVAEVRAALADRCQTMRTVAIEPPAFPLARQSEHHVLCEGFRIESSQVEAIAFAFGDDQLFVLEARGGAVEAFGAQSGGAVMDYMGYTVHDTERFIDHDSDAVWFVSEAGLHPHLFTWSNPLLSDAQARPESPARSMQVPAELVFGGKLATLLAGFKAACSAVFIEDIDEIWLPHGPSSQTQVNCFGFDYAGFPRKIEAVFGDATLDVVNILTARPEEERLRQALTATFGDPQLTNDVWEVYGDGRIALRKDTPEIVMISATMLPYYRPTFRGE